MRISTIEYARGLSGVLAYGAQDAGIGNHHDKLSEHITAQDDGTLLGLTETGRFHIEQLRLNRPALVTHRVERQRREEETRRHAEILQGLLEAREEIRLLRRRLDQRLGG